MLGCGKSVLIVGANKRAYSMTGDVGMLIQSRDLTDDERRVLRWLLTGGARLTGTDPARAAAFLPQLDRLRVVGRCRCGCPSIDLTLDCSHLVVDDVSATIADVDGPSSEGTEIGLILQAKHGSLSNLEAYARDGRVPFTLPTDEQLSAFW